MKLEIISDMAPQAWDEAIDGFDTKCLFHQSAWLNYIEETQGAKTLRFRITDNGKQQGYFTGLIVRKGPLQILGSPLPGWTTDYMGPIVNKDFDFEKFIDTLDATCRLLKIHHIELSSHFLPVDLMRRKGYAVQEKITYVVSLSEDEELMRKRLDRKCRQNIRKAIKKNLVVEECNDQSVIDEYYLQLIDVFARQKLVPTYSLERVRSLFKILHPGSIVALQVRHEDKVIATGLFPYDSRCVYIFGAASYRKFQGLYPNELLYWTSMTMFGKKGLPQMDMCGDGSFKPKFGAREVKVYRYAKSYNAAAKLGRELYRKAYSVKQALNGRLAKFRV